MGCPAEGIIHGFLPEMVGQKRGLPWMATGLFRMKQLVGFENAAIVNARIGASKMGVIQWKEGRGPDLDDEELEAFEMTAEPGDSMGRYWSGYSIALNRVICGLR